MPESPLLREGQGGGHTTEMSAVPSLTVRGRVGLPFNSSETLEMCDVRISENGKIEVATKSYHSDALERLGTPEKTIRGRVKMEKQSFVFEPYAEASRRPTYKKHKKQVHVGSCTTLAVTADKFKISMVMGRHMGQARTIDFIRAEMDDILHQLEGELYNEIVKTPSNLPLYGEEDPLPASPSMGRGQSPSPTNQVNTPEALPIEGKLSEGLKGSQEGGAA